MHILLINPSQRGIYGKMRAPLQIHMGLAYLGAVAEQSTDKVEILDIDAQGMRPEDFRNKIKQNHIDIAGITVTTPALYSALQLAEILKTNNPDTLVVFGGMHPTIRPFETMSFKSVDVVVKGEGEITFQELIKAVKEKKDFASIKGIVYRQDGKMVQTSGRPLISNLDALPFPARHLFKDYHCTFPDSLYKHSAAMITSRGCPGYCNYCAAHNIFQRICRVRSAKNVVDEIELLVKKNGTKEIHIWDDNFATKKERVYQIRDEIIKRNLKVKFAFPNGIRADYLDKDILMALRQMGTYSLAIGVESGTQKILDNCHKGIKLEKIEELFLLLKKMKFESWAFFLIGALGENTQTIKNTIKIAKKLDPDIAKFHILKPFPGTEVYAYLQKKGFLLSDDYSQFGFHTPPVHRLEELGPSEILSWQKKAYLSFYLRPAKIIKQILRIKTFNRLKLNLRSGLDLLKMIF